MELDTEEYGGVVEDIEILDKLNPAVGSITGGGE